MLVRPLVDRVLAGLAPLALLAPLVLLTLFANVPLRAQQEPTDPAADAAAAARRQQAAQRELDAIRAVVQGVCVDGATGKPLAGCRVALDCWGGRDRADAAPPKELVDPEPVVTGADGVFRVHVLAHVDWQVGLDVSCEGRWPRTGRWHHLPAGHVEDLGHVALHRGVHARGRVVDQNGDPVPNVSVGFAELPLFLGSAADPYQPPAAARPAAVAPEIADLASHAAANTSRYGRSAADGTFTTKDPLPACTATIRISQPGLTLVGPATVAIPSREPMQPVEIVVRQEPFVGGVVVDETGAPVEGVSLSAVLRRSGRMASAWSGKDGTFRIHRVENCPDEIAIDIEDPGPCEPARPTAAVPWGTHDVRIVLQRSLTVPLTVVEADSGKPVEDFAVRLWPLGNRVNSQWQRLRLSGHHDGGTVALAPVRRGPNRLVVVPKDERLLYAQLDVTGAEDMAPLRVEVQRLVPMMVQVLDAQKLPARRVDVLAILPGNWQGRQDYGPYDPRSDHPGAISSDPAITFDTLVGKATTDEGGQCIVHGIPGRDDLMLAVRIGNKIVLRCPDVSFGGERTWRQLVLPDAAAK